MTTPSSKSPLPSRRPEIALIDVFEACLCSQIKAIRKLRCELGGEPSQPQLKADGRRVRKGRSQVDLAFDILKDAASPLHISELLLRIKQRFSRNVDSESLVSALSKRVARKDRFARTAPNTFTLR